MILLGLRVAGLLPGEQRDGEHAQRERREREPGLASRCTRAPSAGRSGARSSSRRARSAAASATRSRAGSTSTGRGRRRAAPACPRACAGRATRRASPARPTPTAISAPTASPPSCQTRIPSTTPPMPDRREDRADDVDPPRPVYGTSWTRLLPTSTIAMITTSPTNATRHERYVVMKPPMSGPTAAAIAAAAPTSAYAFRCIGALEVAVDQRLHRGKQQRGAEPADDRPEDDDRQQALGERHRDRADRVAEQADHVGPLAADQVADLAPDQDERRRDERLERDRRLHAARRRVADRARPPRSTRSSATCRRRGRTSPSRAGCASRLAAVPLDSDAHRFVHHNRPYVCSPGYSASASSFAARLLGSRRAPSRRPRASGGRAR